MVGDGAANNIGAGCSTKDKIALMIGTSGAMRVVFRRRPAGETCRRRCGVIASRDERVVVGGALSDGGGLLQWLVQSLNVDDDMAELQTTARSARA